MVVKYILALLLFCVPVFLLELSGQEPQKKLTHFSVEDGLSQSSVHSIIQDGYGYLWISTGNGLNCFDGKNFTSYFPPIAPKSSFKVNRMRKVIFDDIGNLWIGTDEGLFYFNRITNQMEDPFPEIKKIKDGYCYPLFLNGDTIHALLADSSVLSINIRDHKFRKTQLETSFFGVISTENGSDELVGVSISTSLWFFGLNSAELTVQNFKFNKQFSGYLSDIEYYKENKYFILFHDEILLFNKTTGKLEQPLETIIPLEVGKSVYKSITRLKSGEVWIGTSSQGIFVLDSTLAYKYQIIGESDHTEHINQLKNITTIFEDKSGNIWVGTDGNGIGLLNPDYVGLNLLNNESVTNGKLSSDFIWSFYEDDENNLWIGTSNEGINKWNRKTNTIENFLLSNKKTFPTPNDVYSICPVREQELLIGTSCGIWLFDKNSHRSFPISNNFNENHIRRTNAIIPIDNNHYITQIHNRCFFISEKGESWKFDTIQISDTVIINLTFQSITGRIFGFSNKGIYEITKQNITYKPFIYLTSQMMLKTNSIVELSDGLMCVASDKGLAVMDFKGHIYKIYNTTDGLSNHYLYGILADSKENLWMSSNKGLSQFSPTTGKFNNYGMNDGLQSYEFNAGATYKNLKGEMFFGGINGFNYFHPDSLYAAETSPAVVISGIKVNDLFFLTDTSIMAKKILNLEYNRNTVTFEFNAIEFINPGFITYTCLLEGYDKDWISLGTVPSIRYSKLPPGKYNFLVKAASRQGNWSETPAKIILLIARPYWMKTWFILLLAVLGVSIISIAAYFLSTIKIRRKLAILEHQQEISLIHSRISSDLHDDIGSGLSKLAMLSDTTIAKAADNPEVVQRLTNVSTSARRLIDQLRVIVWTLNPQYDQIDSLISYIHQQAGEFLDDSPLKATFILPEKIQSLIVTPEFKRNIHYTVMEVLHNAVKHSGAKEIFIEIAIPDNHLEIIIRDTGKGFDPDQISGFGNGLHFIQKRMNDIKGKLEMESRKSTGTTIRIIAPL
jgi:signal transduction histidine kinase/ligand-binding sensor domain-containing protein